MNDVGGMARKILESCLPNWIVKSYGINDDFLWLWDSDDNGLSEWLNKAEAPQNLLVIWDNMPETSGTDKSLLDFVTPLDWVLLYASRLLHRWSGNSVLPSLRIGIVDLHSHHWKNAPSITLMPAILEALPWVKLWRLVPGQAGFQQAVADFLDDLDQSSSTLFCEMPCDEQAKVDALLGAWQGALMQGRDHHAVSNKIGPWLLMDHFRPPGGGDCQTHPSLPERPVLRALLSHCRGLIQHQNLGQQPELANLDAEFLDKVDLVLIDDQVRDGWDQVVGAICGFSNLMPYKGDEPQLIATRTRDGARLIASSSAEFLLENLRKASFKTRNYNYRFFLQQEKKEEVLDEVLLLDLRLFSFKGIEEEKKFIKELLNIIKQKKGGNEQVINNWHSLAWDDFSTDELTKIENWIAHPTRTGGDYVIILTLLPRLLALASPSTPILLFSATSRRDILAKLQTYNNIITSLEKPRFNLDGLSMGVALFLERWKQAMSMARTLIQGTRELRTICRYRSHVVKKKPKTFFYVEVFFDETYLGQHRNPTHICVGGCFAIFEGSNKNTTLAAAERFNEILLENGVRYFDDLRGAPTTPILSKKQSCLIQLQNALTAFENEFKTRPKLEGFRIKISLPSGIFSEIGGIDQQFRKALAACAELLLYETIPKRNGFESWEKRVQFSFYVATKVYLVDKTHFARSGEDGSPIQWEQADHLSYKYGCFRLPDTDLLVTIDRASVYPVILDIMRLGRRIDIERAVATRLSYEFGGKPKERKPRFFYCPKCGKQLDVGSDWSKKLCLAENPDLSYGVIQKYDNAKKLASILKLPYCQVNEPITARFASKVALGDIVSYLQNSLGKWVINKVYAPHERTFIHGIFGPCGCNEAYMADLRALHYLADEFLDDFEKESIDKRYYNFTTALNNGGFDDVFNECLKLMLQASRLSQMGDPIMACVRASEGLVAGESSEQFSAAIKTILGRLAAQAQSFEGREIRRFCEIRQATRELGHSPTHTAYPAA